MRITGFLSIAFFSIGFSLQLKAQNGQFSYTQYAENLTPLNPAYSLLDKAGSVTLLARKQWVGINGAPSTLIFNGNLPIESINGAAGLNVMNDNFAVEHQFEINAYFAKAIQLETNSYLGVSLNAGLRNYRANYSELDSGDPSFKDDVRQTKPNLGFGVIYYTDWYYVGFSLPELTLTSLGTASVQNINNFRNHYYFSAGCITNLSDEFSFKPAALVSYANGVPLVGDISGTLYIKNQLGIGVNYRTNNQAAGIILINIESVRLGYSYQFGTSSANLGGFNNATHEVSLSFRFGKGASVSKLL
jgi:type IX secretion system PorP/SprF family membrane protein